jgi:hypothetical protein
MADKRLSKEEFQKLFREIKKKGYIKTARSGSTGVGHTLEKELGIAENNSPLSDLKFAELKAHRKGVSSMITLFTFDRGAWGETDKRQLIAKHGTWDEENQRQGLYFTMKHGGKTETQLHVFCDEESVSLKGPKGQVLASWPLASILTKFKQKMPALVVVSAESEMRGNAEYFRYTRAKLYHNTTLPILRREFLAGNITLDLRMHDAITKIRNHGTAFRAREDKLEELFSESEIIG